MTLTYDQLNGKPKPYNTGDCLLFAINRACAACTDAVAVDW